MKYRRLIPPVLTFALVLGAAGAITQAASFLAAAPGATAEAPRATGPVYNGKALTRAVNVLQGAAGLVGRDKPEPVRQEPTPDRKPATRDIRPDPEPVPDKGAAPAPPPALATPPTVRQEWPESNPAPAPRAKERPASEKPVIV